MYKLKFLLITFCFLNLSVFAFRPIGHVILKDKIVQSLPIDNIFRIAMERYPKIASWGSIGPDLGYNLDLSRTFKSKWKRQIKNSLQLSDIAHYHKVGSFVTNLINEALEKGDYKFLAFVGGWITHIAGDFGSHGIYVKPEAGYYIAYEGGRELHSELEKISDAYLYRENAKYYCLSGWEFNSEYYWKEFFGVSTDSRNRSQNIDSLDCMLGGNVEKYFIDVYQKTYDIKKVTFNLVNLASNYYRAVGKGLGKYAGFKQYTVIEASEKILLKQRQERIDSAFNAGIEYGREFLTKAVSLNKTFSDTWNLDIGKNGEPTYVIRIDAGKKLISRTKNDLYLSFTDKNGKESSQIKITTKIGPLNFAFYQEDTYYYAVNMGGAMGEIECWKLGNVIDVTLSIRTRKRYSIINQFRIKQVILYYNGQIIGQVGDANNNNLIILNKSNPIKFTF